MEKESEKGSIHVTAREENGDLVISISDDGIGMSTEALAAILTKAVSKRTGGFGIRNIEERIQLNYGPLYGLSFDSTLGEGTTVQIRIPKSTDK